MTTRTNINHISFALILVGTMLILAAFMNLSFFGSDGIFLTLFRNEYWCGTKIPIECHNGFFGISSKIIFSIGILIAMIGGYLGFFHKPN